MLKKTGSPSIDCAPLTLKTSTPHCGMFGRDEVVAVGERGALGRRRRGALQRRLHPAHAVEHVQIESGRPAGHLASLRFVHDYRTVGGRSVFEVDGEHIHDVMAEIVKLGVHGMVAHPPTLEQLLMRHYGQQPSREVAQDTPEQAAP